MTDTELKRRKAICEVANVSDIGDLSDGFHTFNGLYYQRVILFAALVRAYKDRAWKSYRHEDGELCFGGGWFIVGIDTPEGSYTYHYENKDFDRFDCVELPCGKHWDGHTEDDVTRLLSLPTISPDEDHVMPRYIDADALKDVIQQHDYPLADRMNSIDNGMFTPGIFQAIDQMPTISPDEVRGVGDWKQKEIINLEDTTIEQMQSACCSVCGKYHTTPFSYYFSKYNYCPNCGAKMEVTDDA